MQLHIYCTQPDYNNSKAICCLSLFALACSWFHCLQPCQFLWTFAFSIFTRVFVPLATTKHTVAYVHRTLHFTAQIPQRTAATELVWRRLGILQWEAFASQTQPQLPAQLVTRHTYLPYWCGRACSRRGAVPLTRLLSMWMQQLSGD